MATPSQPTGLYTTTFRNKIEIRWVENPETNVKGYNVYNSTTSGGGVSGYVKLNQVLIEEANEVKTETVTQNEDVTEVGNTRTTVTTTTFQDVNIYLFTHEDLTEATTQYYVVTAVNEIGEESPFSIEVSDTPLLIDTELVEEPLRTQNDITLDYIETLLSRNPQLDVKPGSVTRQLHIDPNAREIAFTYIRRDFISRSQSFISLNEIDDADEDRISDPVSNSTYKTNLKSAFFLEDDADVQSIIDSAYDKLAGNTGTVRQAAEKARGTVTFYTEVAPTSDITVPKNTEISTVPTETDPAIRFITLSEVTLEAATITNFFNPVTQRYEVDVNIEAVEASADGNVNANTITNSNVSGVQVTNKSATFNGTDQESNADLSDRAILAFIGLDVGTAAGYKKTVTKIPSVTDVKIVDAGDPLMQRDYDEVRKKHVYGKVDIYVRGGSVTQQQDTVGFLFKQKADEDMEIVDTADFRIKTNSSDVDASKPIFSIREINNVTKGANYDLLGNWLVYKNSVEMEKILEVSVDLVLGQITFIDPLTFGDVITADYDYKTTVTGETLIDPAGGGEVNFTLQDAPVVKNSATIYKNDVALTENVDYTLTLANGFLQLSSGLTTGDKLTADYQYITRVLGEVVVSSASGGEVQENLVNQNILESVLIESDGITIDIEETNFINNLIGMDTNDIIRSTFRYRDSDSITLLKQPVDSIISVESSVSGQLTQDIHYTFNKIDDILLEGNSVNATRSIQITYAGGIPIGELTDTSENVVLINNEFIPLSQKGIDTESIIVKDSTTTYARNVDYLIKEEADGVNVQIARSITSNIPNGGTVTVLYEYGELLTITYNVNPLIELVQDEIEVVRHVTADVLVKGVLRTDIDFEISVVISRGSDEVIVASNINTAISNEINKRKLGEGIAQSDIIRVIEEVTNVESVVVPLTKMVKADGTQINRELITSQFNLYQSSVVNSYSTGANALLNKTLGSNASDGFYSIFEDDRPLTLVSSANDVDSAAGQGFISSNGEIIVSTIEGDMPDAHSYTVSYIVNGETGSKDIKITSLEYIATGQIIITTAFQGS